MHKTREKAIHFHLQNESFPFLKHGEILLLLLFSAPLFMLFRKEKGDNTQKGETACLHL